MKKEQYDRKANRLKNHNYSQCGYYFVTICTKEHEEWFGKIRSKRIILNKYGSIANFCWISILQHFSRISLEEYIIMPNHIHGIIVVENAGIYVGNNDRCSLQHTNRNMELIPKIISQYKSSVTRLIYKIGNNSFAWQKSFYDHIIRNEQSFNTIREYIMNNPSNWEEDKSNTHAENTYL